MAEFVMPKLGADMTSGKLIAWRKVPGDKVTRGEIIADVETDKADIEVEVFSTGIFEKALVAPGTTVPIGTPLAIIHVDGEKAAPAAGPAPAAAPVPAAPPPPAAAEAPAKTIAGEGGRARVSPVARKRAAELGIDAGALAGTGPGGRVTLEDVERAAAKPAAAAAAPAADRDARMRQAIALAMARSKREIPHYYLRTTIDMGRALAWLAEANGKRSVEDRLVPGVLLVKAVALALRAFPDLNAFYVDGRSVPGPGIHVGVAVSLRKGGLVAPALHDADARSLDELMGAFRDLVTRARAGTLRGSEVSDPTITVTSLGEQGVESVFGIIHPPQVALVGFGRIAEAPCARDGQVVVRPVVTATLSADHRVSDGHRGGLFLNAIDKLLQEPEKL